MYGIQSVGCVQGIEVKVGVNVADISVDVGVRVEVRVAVREARGVSGMDVAARGVELGKAVRDGVIVAVAVGGVFPAKKDCAQPQPPRNRNAIINRIDIRLQNVAGFMGFGGCLSFLGFGVR